MDKIRLLRNRRDIDRRELEIIIQERPDLAIQDKRMYKVMKSLYIVDLLTEYLICSHAESFCRTLVDSFMRCEDMDINKVLFFVALLFGR